MLHFPPLKGSKISKSDNVVCFKKCGQFGLLTEHLRQKNNGINLFKRILTVCIKINILLSDSTFLESYLKKQILR
jgi:hypothetical protein